MLLHAEANSSLGHSLRIVTHINSIPFKHYELVKTHIHIKTVAIKEKERTKNDERKDLKRNHRMEGTGFCVETVTKHWSEFLWFSDASVEAQQTLTA